jgi:hypothetical protein
MPVIIRWPRDWRYVVAHGLLMPDRFNRTAAPFWSMNLRSDSGAGQGRRYHRRTPYLAVLDEVAEFTAGSDMPDVVRAKLCKARALRCVTARLKSRRPRCAAQALTWIGAGVKKLIDKLASQLKTAAATISDSEVCWRRWRAE